MTTRNLRTCNLPGSESHGGGKSRTFSAVITRGFDGSDIGADLGTFNDFSMAAIAVRTKARYLRFRVGTYNTFNSFKGYTVMDFGDWSYFGRITVKEEK